MFEHLRNWPERFAASSGWLSRDGRFFMHVFAHRGAPYAFVVRDASDWMSRHFFSGGMMPSDDLALRFQDDLRLLRRWRWDGTHYAAHRGSLAARTWTRRRDALMPVVRDGVRRRRGALWWQRWRLFFLSCAELFGYEGGQQWWVSHYLFGRARERRCTRRAGLAACCARRGRVGGERARSAT